MDLAELMVERFLTLNGRAFVCSQFTLKQEPNWKASLDFVVLEFCREKKKTQSRGQIIMVEVGEGGSLRSVATKAKACIDGGYLELLKAQLAEETGGVTAGWPVYFLGFLKDQALVDAAYRDFGHNGNLHFRPLRDTIEDYWAVRERGLLPERPPYLGV